MSEIKYNYYIDFNRDAYLKTGLPFINVNISGYDGYFLVDSGANVSAICYEKASTIDELKDLELVTDKEGNIQTSEVTSVNINKPKSLPRLKCNFKIDDVEFENETFQLLDLHCICDNVKHDGDIDMVGILGTNFFFRNKWLIDFNQARIYCKA